MKNYTTIIIVFAFLLVVIAGAVVGWKFLEGEQAKKAEEQYRQYVQKYKTQEAAVPRPGTPTATVTAAPTITPSSQSVTASGLDSELSGLSDDGGKADFDQMQTDINSL